MRASSVALGVVLAALAPGLCVVGYGIVASVGDERTIDLVAFAFLVLSIAFVLALIPTLILGLPLVLWLRSHKALDWLHICLGAAISGALLVPLLSWALAQSRPFAPQAFLIGGGLGLASGFAFCIGARPKNSFNPKPQQGDHE